MIKTIARFAISICAACVGSAAYAIEPVEVAKINVALFDELVECSADPLFKSHGFSPASPCRDWFEKTKKQQTQDKILITGGFLCLAGDILVAGQSLRTGDMDHFNFVRAEVNRCREDVGGN